VTGSRRSGTQLNEHPDLDLVGWSEHVAEAAPALTGGHLQCILHATRSSTLPEHELAQVREHTQSPVVILASGEASALLEQALDADVADVLLLPQLADNVVFAIRKAAPRRPAAPGRRRPRPPRADPDGLLAEGRDGQDVTATNLATSFAKNDKKRALLIDLDLQFGDAAIMLGVEPEKTIYDLVVARASSTPRSSRATRPATRRASTSSRAASAGGRRARHRGRRSRGCWRSRASRTT
jgi:hypothetical protein